MFVRVKAIAKLADGLQQLRMAQVALRAILSRSGLRWVRLTMTVLPHLPSRTCPRVPAARALDEVYSRSLSG